MLMQASEQIPVPGCPGTTVRRLPATFGPNALLVEVKFGGEIPPHVHDCKADMFITKGSAVALGENGARRLVGPCDLVAKKPLELHGYTEVGKDGLAFLSLSGGNGILRGDGGWDMEYAA